MAAQAPDPRTLQSWEEAFAHPIPVVRKLEQQLRTSIADNRDKVRSLVGSGYRDLLGTADRIIAMDAEMQRLEDVIAGIGQKCNSRVVAKIGAQQERLVALQREDRTAGRRPAAEVALMQSCLSVCQRLVKAGGDCLLAARLLLLARLLQNSASRSRDGPRLLAEQRLKVNSQKSRLLSFIDARIGDSGVSRAQMLDLLLAYALVTSSSLADVFRHLLRVRQNAIAEFAASRKAKSMIQAVDLLFATLAQAKNVFPKRMSEAVERLMGPRLLHDEKLRSALDFDLDLYERWISPDVRSFVPWLRHNDLETDALNVALKKWSEEGSNTILNGLRELLASLKTPVRIVKLRERVVRHLLGSDTKAAGFDKEPFLLEVRWMFAERLSAIITRRSETVSDALHALLVATSQPAGHCVGNLWDPEVGRMDLRQGAGALRHEIAIRSDCKDTNLQHFESSLEAWANGLKDVRKSIKEMQQARWEDDLNLDDDIDSDTSIYQTALAKDDPQNLQNHLNTEIARVLNSCLTTLLEAASEKSKDDRSASKAVYTLRTLRLLSKYLTTESSLKQATKLTVQVHEEMAKSVTASVSHFGSSDKPIQRLFQGNPATSLWQGSPPLPVQPYPRTFRFLRDLCAEMNGVGSDVWTGSAVDAVKLRAVEIVQKAVTAVLDENVEPSSTNGTETEDGEPQNARGESSAEGTDTEEAEVQEDGADDTSRESKRVEQRTQTLFDVLYLREVLAASKTTGTGNSLGGEIGRLKAGLDLPDDGQERLNKNAAAYHRRSYLMFGVLAST